MPVTPDVLELCDRIEGLAKLATAGPWRCAIGSIGGPSIVAEKNGRNYFIADFRTKFIHFGESGKEWEDIESEAIATAHMVTALDPASVLALVAAARRGVEAEKWGLKKLIEMIDALVPTVTGRNASDRNYKEGLIAARKMARCIELAAPPG